MFVAVMHLALAQAPPPAQESAETEIARVVDRFKAQFSAQDAVEAKAIEPVKAAFIKELSKLRDEAKARANLDAALEAETALKAANEGAPLPSGKRLAKEFVREQATYERNRDLALRTHAPARARIEADYERTLTELEKKYTRLGKLEGAEMVREARNAGPMTSSRNVLSTMTGVRQSRDGLAIVVNPNELATPGNYRPPIEIEYVLKTDSQVRIGYAASQIIFNWELDNSELRVDSGPVASQHRPGAGAIPKNELVRIRQVVRPKEMIFYVNGKERARWSGDFSRINDPIRIKAHGSILQIQGIYVRKPGA